jgi:hypothetical protein
MRCDNLLTLGGYKTDWNERVYLVCALFYIFKTLTCIIIVGNIFYYVQFLFYPYNSFHKSKEAYKG